MNDILSRIGSLANQIHIETSELVNFYGDELEYHLPYYEVDQSVIDFVENYASIHVYPSSFNSKGAGKLYSMGGFPFFLRLKKQ